MCRQRQRWSRLGIIRRLVNGTRSVPTTTLEVLLELWRQNACRAKRWPRYDDVDRARTEGLMRLASFGHLGVCRKVLGDLRLQLIATMQDDSVLEGE